MNFFSIKICYRPIFFKSLNSPPRWSQAVCPFKQTNTDERHTNHKTVTGKDFLHQGVLIEYSSSRVTDYCFSWPSPIVASTDKDSIKSSAYNICNVHCSFKGTELFIIPNVQALNIPYSFFVSTGYSLFPFHLRLSSAAINRRPPLSHIHCAVSTV